MGAMPDRLDRIYHRQKYLPIAIRRTEIKLAQLYSEAEELALNELLDASRSTIRTALTARK